MTATLPRLNSFNLPWPADWDALFGRRAPLILEIGFGRGQFLRHLARAHPDHNIIGLEISNRCLTAAESAIARLQLTNVRVVHALAETALRTLFPPASLAQVHVNFPDPWFKTRHSGRRLMQRDTLDVIVNRLAPGGLFFLATDIVEYADMSAALLAATPALDNLLPGPWASDLPGRVVTKYEAAARREGRDCYYFAYRRSDRTAPPVPAVKEFAMPHAVFTGPLSLDDVMVAFRPWDETDGETVVSLIDCYRGRQMVLFEVFVKEPALEQRVAVILRERAPGEFTLLLSPLGHPRPTDGIHTAVAALGRWLLRQQPDVRLAASKVRGLS